MPVASEFTHKFFEQLLHNKDVSVKELFRRTANKSYHRELFLQKIPLDFAMIV